MVKNLCCGRIEIIMNLGRRPPAPADINLTDVLQTTELIVLINIAMF